MRNLCVRLAIPIAVLITLGFQATAQEAPPATAAPQYFTLNLPAGVSLVSSPMKTGQALAVNEFQGLPEDSLFFWWNSDSQSWVAGDQAPAYISGGYWVYLPVPAILVLQGQPYDDLTQVSEAIVPGWHLFGVPFGEGSGWKDFRLYNSGNPISLDTAIANGWIDSDITTMQGSEVQHLSAGQPLLPGVAYWIHTLVPLNLRAERQTQAAAAAAATTATPTPQSSTLTAMASASSSQLPNSQCSTGTPAEIASTDDAMGWLSEIGEFLKKTVEASKELADNNWFGATSGIASATFGLLDKGLGSSQADKISDVESTLNTLVSDVKSVSCQLNYLDNTVQGQGYWGDFTNLSKSMLDTENWLWNYFQNPNGQVSREYFRWQMAGCGSTSCPENPSTPASPATQGTPYVAPGPDIPATTSLPSPSPGSYSTPASPAVAASAGTVTQTAYANFMNNWMTSYLPVPAPPAVPASHDDYKTSPTLTSDAPYFWALSVLALPPGTNQFSSPALASTLEYSLYQGLTTDLPSKGSALHAYMEYVFSQSPCAQDVTACDLYTDVYQPVENLFLRAIADQTQLVEAQAEAQSVLAAKQGAGLLQGMQTVMKTSTQYLNAEAEAFVKIAEQIALLQAADGTYDWNTFGSSSAAVLLARADFLAAQLAGQNYLFNPPAGYINPPWPYSGVVGRVFYAEGETPLSGTRSFCAGTGTTGCAFPAGAFSEIPWGQVTGDWPYLLWTTAPSGRVIGTPHVNWTVQRLKPQNLSAGSYTVSSTVPGRLTANLTVQNYDSHYNNMPNGSQTLANTPTIAFGSFNGLEGPLGKYGLNLGAASIWKFDPEGTVGARATKSTATSPPEILFSTTFNDSDATPTGASLLSSTYPTQQFGDDSVLMQWWAWTTIQLANGTLPNSWSGSTPKYHVQWTTKPNVNLSANDKSFYSGVDFSQQFLNGTSDPGINNSCVKNATCVRNTQCNGKSTSFFSNGSFSACTFTETQAIDAASVPLNLNSPYTFQAYFASLVNPHVGLFTSAHATGYSTASWTILPPTITITKQ